jgi:hypothetical protein
MQNLKTNSVLQKSLVSFFFHLPEPPARVSRKSSGVYLSVYLSEEKNNNPQRAGRASLKRLSETSPLLT